MDEAPEKRVGTTLNNKWKLERLIGTGGMAAVYLAVHKIGRRDAIKILHADVAKSKDLRARFEQEALATNRFRHPGAVEIRDMDVAEDGSPFLVMELLEGESLTERANRLKGEIPIGDVLGWIDQLLDVLAAAHAQGIVHRDIKLDNLFLLGDGTLKVLDFGIARIRDGVRLARTQTGATLGTTPYMPPEQAQGLEVDHRADLFSVGATMFRIFAKRRIHDARGDAELLAKMATEPAPPLASVAPSVPPNVCMLVDRALAFLRDRRYPDALTMQIDVRAVRAGGEPPFAKARLLAGEDPLVGGVVASGRALPHANMPTLAGHSRAARPLPTSRGDEPTAGSTPAPPAPLPPRASPMPFASPAIAHVPAIAAVPIASPSNAPRPISTPPPPETLAAPQPGSVPPRPPSMPPAAHDALGRTASSSPTVQLPAPRLGESTLRSEAPDPSFFAQPPPASFGAPSIRVVDAPPVPPPSQAPPSLGAARPTPLLPLLVIAAVFLLVGAGVVFLFARRGSSPESVSASASVTATASAPLPAASAFDPLPAPTPVAPAPPAPAKPHLTGRLPVAPPPAKTGHPHGHEG